MASAIEVRNLRKVFDGMPALDGVSLAVPTGAVYGLVGPNGCGKSTLVSHLCGVMRPTSGDVFVLGEKVFENPSVKAHIVTNDPRVSDMRHWISIHIKEIDPRLTIHDWQQPASGDKPVYLGVYGVKVLV